MSNRHHEDFLHHFLNKFRLEVGKLWPRGWIDRYYYNRHFPEEETEVQAVAHYHKVVRGGARRQATGPRGLSPTGESPPPARLPPHSASGRHKEAVQ